MDGARDSPARPVQRLAHPLVPAAGIAALAAAGLIGTYAGGLRAGAWTWASAWWILIGLVSGYAISGSV